VIDKSLADQLHEDMQAIDRIRTFKGNVNFEEGKIWTRIQDTKSWKHSGSPAKSFKAYCENERGYKFTNVSNMIKVVKTFNLESEAMTEKPIFSRLVKALKFVGSPEEACNWYHAALSLGEDAWQDALTVAKGKQPKDTCACDGDQDVLYKCKKCNRVHK
jgi:hypothetical protein